MTRTLWWPGSGLFLAQEPQRRDRRAGRCASFFAGLVLALALLALLALLHGADGEQYEIEPTCDTAWPCVGGSGSVVIGQWTMECDDNAGHRWPPREGRHTCAMSDRHGCEWGAAADGTCRWKPEWEDQK